MRLAEMPTAGKAVVALRGASAGAVRFWVAAEGFLARDLRVLVGEGERWGVRVVMSPRP